MNTKVHIKICGMRDPENILQVAELRPDYMGFIFYPKSKRFVGDDFKIPDQFAKNIKRVGVFVNEATDTIRELVARHKLDFVQLHGNESVEQCEELKANKVGVIKVFSMDQQFDFAKLNPYKKVVDFFLFDTKSEGFGGSGKTFDWTLLNNYDQEVPFFLSGGLSSKNIQDIKLLKGMNLHALDINSGVEITPGVKDIEKIKLLKSQISSLNTIFLLLPSDF